MEKRLRMRIDLTQLRTADAGEGLARRSSYNDIERIQNGSESEFSGKHLWCGRDVTCLGMSFDSAVEVGSVRPRGIRIILNGRCNVEAGSQETEGQAATSRKHIQDT